MFRLPPSAIPDKFHLVLIPMVKYLMIVATHGPRQRVLGAELKELSMTSRAVFRRFPELAVLLILGLLGPACGGGGGDSGGIETTEPVGGGGGAGSVASTVSLPGPMLNRTTGVAPMAVFCCLANAFMPGSTTTLIPQPPDGDYSSSQYSWDFGDPGSGTWATSGLSKNSARGYTAAHVFETPGTYTITATVTDASGATTVYPQTVVVSAFAGTTFYISAAGGNDANDGLSPATAWQTVGKVFQNIGTSRRYLFNRGETFSTPGRFTINSPGPGLIGAYGSGAKPVVRVTGAGGCVGINTSDWTVTDLEFIGSGAGDQGSAVTLHETVQISRTLLLRLTVHDFNVNLGWSDWPTMYPTPHDGNVVADCFAYNGITNGFYMGGRHLALLGNTVQDSQTSHLVRLWQAHKAVVAHNVFVRPGGDRHSLKVHSPTAGDGRPETQFVTISDNVFAGQVWEVILGPQNTTTDERVSQVIFERNAVGATVMTQVGLVVKAREVTVRNNIFNGTGASEYFSMVGVGQSVGLEPPAKNVRVFNNTLYRSDVSSQLAIVSFDVRCSDAIIRNNLASAPLAKTMSITSGSCPNLIMDHNLLTLTPGFVNAAGLDFHLAGGSPGIDTGTTLGQVKEDYAGTPRPAGAAYDLGAYEQ
jgi:hypothetical protein